MEVRPSYVCPSGYKQTEVGVIPTEWDVKSLGRFVALQRGHDLTERDRRRGEVPVMGSAGPNGFHDTALVVGPGVVLGRSGASFGQAHYCKTSFWPHNTALYVTDFFGNHPLFAFYFLKGIDFSRHNSGGAQQSLNRNFIAPILVAVPKRKEQEAIAETLSDADTLIESLEQLLVKKRQLKQGAMQELLTGKKRLPGFEDKPGHKPTEVGVIPEDWEVKPLGAIATLYQPITISAKQFTEAGFPVYGANGVVGFYSKSNHDTWQVTVTCRGSTCGTVNRTVERCWITGNAMVLNCDQNKSLSKEFFYHLLCIQDLSGCITGTGQPQIVRSPLAAFSVPLPPTRAEQEAIAAILSDMDTEIAALEAKLAKARDLNQGMMQELLTGRIRLV